MKQKLGLAIRILAAIIAILLGGLYITILLFRIAFILREGGLDRSDGEGSPMAFVLGAILEFLLLGLPSITISLVLYQHKKGIHNEEKSEARGVAHLTQEPDHGGWHCQHHQLFLPVPLSAFKLTVLLSLPIDFPTLM